MCVTLASRQGCSRPIRGSPQVGQFPHFGEVLPSQRLYSTTRHHSLCFIKILIRFGPAIWLCRTRTNRSLPLFVPVNQDITHTTKPRDAGTRFWTYKL